MGRKIKPVYFSKEDECLLEYIKKIPNFSNWVRQQIRRELEVQKTGIDPELKFVVESLVESKLACRVVLDESPQKELPKKELPKKELPKKVHKNEIDILSDLEQFF